MAAQAIMLKQKSIEKIRFSNPIEFQLDHISLQTIMNKSNLISLKQIAEA